MRSDKRIVMLELKKNVVVYAGREDVRWFNLCALVLSSILKKITSNKGQCQTNVF